MASSGQELRREAERAHVPGWVQRATFWSGAAPRSVAVVVDTSLVVTTIFSILTREVVTGFHVIFLLLAIGALTMSYRQFVIRLVVGMTVSTALVIWAVSSLTTPSDELKELPLLTAVLVIIFLVAQARATAASEREVAHEELDRQSDLALVTLRQQLERSQRLEMLGRATSGLAHDLRNVFVVLRGYADDIVQSDVEDVVSCATEMINASDRGIAVVDDLLTVGRQHDHEDAEIEIGPALYQMRAMLRRLTRPGVALQVIASPDLPPVRIDRISLTQVLMNLVANANDAISEPTGRIAVTAQLVTCAQPGEELDRTIAVTVTDDGDGFDTLTMSHAFDADFTSKGAAHSGLGLATVRQIAERFGGTVSIGSTPTIASTVTVSLRVGGMDTLEPPRRTHQGDDDTDRSTASFENTTQLLDGVESADAARHDQKSSAPPTTATKHRRTRPVHEDSR